MLITYLSHRESYCYAFVTLCGVCILLLHIESIIWGTHWLYKRYAWLNEGFVRLLDRMWCCYFQDQMVRLMLILCIYINGYYNLVWRQRSTCSLWTTRERYSFLLYLSLWCCVYFVCFLFYFLKEYNVSRLTHYIFTDCQHFHVRSFNVWL